jgi:hypothetical protein
VIKKKTAHSQDLFLNMKKVLILVAIVLAGMITLNAGEKIRHAPDGRVIDLTIEMNISEITVLPNKVTIQAKAIRPNGELGIIVDMDTLSLKKQNESPPGKSILAFDVELKAVNGKADQFDKMLSAYFGNGLPVSLFKPRGYEGASNLSPKDLSEKGGELFLSDPGVDGKFVWKISSTIDLKHRILTLVVSEMHY